jgi:hypothetical protein
MFAALDNWGLRYEIKGRYTKLNTVVQNKKMVTHAMNTKLLMIIAFLFFLSWRKAGDSFLLFCAIFAAGLCVCVLIYRMENTHTIVDDDSE